MTHSTTRDHEALRKQIEEQIDAYKAAGGIITVLPYGPDEYSQTATVDLDALKKEKARANGMTQFNNRATAETTAKKKKGRRSGPTAYAKKVLSQATCSSPAARARAKASGFKGATA